MNGDSAPALREVEDALTTRAKEDGVGAYRSARERTLNSLPTPIPIR